MGAAIIHGAAGPTHSRQPDKCHQQKMPDNLLASFFVAGFDVSLGIVVLGVPQIGYKSKYSCG